MLTNQTLWLQARHIERMIVSVPKTASLKLNRTEYGDKYPRLLCCLWMRVVFWNAFTLRR
jgi:hypothetical protein